MGTLDNASSFQAYIIQFDSEQWSILQGKNDGSLCYCLQIFTALSLEENYTSFRVDGAWPYNLLWPVNYVESDMQKL